MTLVPGINQDGSFESDKVATHIKNIVKGEGYASSTHNHAIGDVTGLQTALNSKQASGDYATKTDLNSKADTTHNHTIAQVTGLQSAIDGKAPTSHTHAIGDVTGLQSALNSKQASGDYATNAKITELENTISALEARITALETPAP